MQETKGLFCLMERCRANVTMGENKNKLSRLLRDFNNYFILYIFFISIKSSGRVVLKKIIYNNIYKN